MKFTEKVGLIVSEAFSSPSRNSYVTRANGRKVVLREGGNYKGVNLRGADLRGAHLNNTNFENADFSGAVLAGAQLKGANFKGANMLGTIVSGADFTGSITGNKRRVLRGAKASIDPIGIKIEAKE